MLRNYCLDFFCFFSGFWEKRFCRLLICFRRALQNCIPCVQRKIYTKNTFLEKSIFFSTFEPLSKNRCLLSEIFGRGCQNKQLPVQRNMSRKSIFDFFCLFRVLSDLFLLSVKIFSRRAVTTAFFMTRGRFDENYFSWNIYIFSITFGHWAKRRRFLSKNFVRGCQNNPLSVQRNTLRKCALEFYCQFRILSDCYVHFIECFSVVLSKLHSTCP